MNARRTALLALAKLLAPKSTATVVRVALAYDDPPGYVKKHAKSEPCADLPWIALVDALEEQRRLASIDWKTYFEDLTAALDALRSLPKKARRWAWARKREEELEDRSTLEMLEIVGAKLGEEGLVLAQLDTGADEYELVVVPKRRVKRLQSLAKKARYGDIDLFTGSDLRRFEKERLAEDEAKARARAKDPTRQRQFVHPDGRVWITYGHDWPEETGRRYALVTVSGKLGFQTHGRDSDERLMSKKRAVIERARAKLIAAHLAEGFVEIALEVYAARDLAALRARKRKKKKKKKK